MKSKRYVIVNAKRFFTFITLIFLVLAIIVITIINSSKAHGSQYSQTYKEYYVVEGDSLWNISKKFIPEGYDIRRMIYEIKKANDMEDGYIYAGKTIKIPVVKK